jgi:integrase
MAMTIRLVTRGTIFYFRAAVPKDLRPFAQRSEVKISLRTSQRSLALMRCRLICNHVDLVVGKGTAQDQAKPLLREDLFLVLDTLGDDTRAIRDRALLLIGWAGGFRSSELTGLGVTDVEEVREGLVLNLRRSKTDQTGQGRKLGIPLGRTRHCPVAALTAWLDTLNEPYGKIFRPVDRHGNLRGDTLRADAVSNILRGRLTAAGIDPIGYSGHSLRAGLATSAIKAGVPTYKVRAQTGHASEAMLGRYVRDAGLFDGNAAGVLL